MNDRMIEATTYRRQPDGGVIAYTDFEDDEPKATKRGAFDQKRHDAVVSWARRNREAREASTVLPKNNKRLERYLKRLRAERNKQ